MGGLLAVAALLLLCMPGCRPAPPRPVPKPRPRANPPVSPSPAERAAWRAAQADEIREVALRYGLEQYGPYVQGEQWRKERLAECTFFVTVEGKDPSDEFLQRFAGERPVIRKGSERKSYIATHRTDRFFGQIAAIGVRLLEWETDVKVTVWFDAVLRPRDASAWKLLVVNRKGRWVVDRELNQLVT